MEIETMKQPHAVFRGPNGQEIVYLDSFAGDGDILISLDGGATYRAFATSGFGGSEPSHHIGLIDPASGVKTDLYRNKDTLTWMPHTGQSLRWDMSATSPTVLVPDTAGLAWSHVLHQVVPTPKLAGKVQPLPKVRQVEYLFQAEDGSIVYVSSDKYGHSYDSFRFFLGQLGDPLRETGVRDVARYRDGGTTIITTRQGELYAPNKIGGGGLPGRGAQATWLGRPVTKLDPDLFVISEAAEQDGGTLVLVTRKGG